jgi:hypothetical protein
MEGSESREENKDQNTHALVQSERRKSNLFDRDITQFTAIGALDAFADFRLTYEAGKRPVIIEFQLVLCDDDIL